MTFTGTSHFSRRNSEELRERMSTTESGILYSLSRRINSSAFFTIAYYVIVFFVMSWLLFETRIITTNVPFYMLAFEWVAIGAIIGVLHRRVLMPKDLRSSRRFQLGAIILISGAVVTAIAIKVLERIIP